MTQSDWLLDCHTHKTEHVWTITRNTSRSVLSMCIRALCASTMASRGEKQPGAVRPGMKIHGNWKQRHMLILIPPPWLSAMPKLRSEVLHVRGLCTYIRCIPFVCSLRIFEQKLRILYPSYTPRTICCLLIHLVVHSLCLHSEWRLSCHPSYDETSTSHSEGASEGRE